jgi:O-antigen ligase
MPHSRPASVSERIRFGLLAAIVVWAPVPWGSYDRWSMLLLAGLLTGLGAWHLAALAISRTPLRPATHDNAPALVLLAVLAVWQWLQVWTVSISPWDTQEFALLATGFAAAAFLVTELVRDRRRFDLFAWVILGACTLQAVYAVSALYAGQPFTLFDDKLRGLSSTHGTFFNRNHFAAYMAMGLSLGIGMMVAQLADPARSWRQRLRNLADIVLSGKAALRVVLVILVIALILTRSRMGNMGFFGALTVTAAVWVLVTRRLERGMVLFLGSIAVLDLALIGTYFGVEQVAQRIQETASAENPDERIDVLAAMIPMLKEHWLLGTGAGTFLVAFVPFRTAEVDVLFRNAHNDYAQILAEMGLIGALCLLGFWLWCLVGSVRAMGSRDRWFRGMGFGGVMLAAYMALHATVEFNLYIPGLALNLLVTGTLLGCVVPSLRADARAHGRH